MRTVFPLAMIITSMAASCYLQAAEKLPAAEQSETEMSEADRAKILEWKKTRDEWLKSDVGTAYVFWLCSLTGPERERALTNAARDFGIVTLEALRTIPNAEASGYRPLECAKPKTSRLGYTWSNWFQREVAI